MTAEVVTLYEPLLKPDDPRVSGHVARILSDLTQDLPDIVGISGVVSYRDGSTESFSSAMTIEDIALALLVYQNFANAILGHSS